MKGRPWLPTAYTDAAQRRKIVYGVAEVVASVGYREASVGKLVRAAHVSRSTFYALFSSREGAFSGMLKLGVAEAIEAVERVDADDDAERVVLRIEALLGFIRETPDLAQAVLIYGPILTNPYAAELDRIALLLGLPDPVAHLVTGGVEWMLRRQIVEEKPINGDLFLALCAFVIPHFDPEAPLPALPNSEVRSNPDPPTKADHLFTIKAALDAAELYQRYGNSATDSALTKAIAKARVALVECKKEDDRN